MGFVGILFLVSVPMIIILLLSFLTARQNTLDMFDRQTGNVLSEVSLLIAGQLDPVAVQTGYTADMVRSGEIDPSDASALTLHLTGALSGMPQVGQLAFIDTHGGMLRINRKNRRIKQSDWSDDAQTMEMIRDAGTRKEGYWGEFFFAEKSRTTLLNFRMPLWRDGKFQGVLIAVVSTGTLSAFISRISARQNINAFILHGPDHVLAHPGMSRFKFVASDTAPLPSIAQSGDPVLVALMESEEWRQPLNSASALAGQGIVHANQAAHAVGYRFLDGYGEMPWIIGVSIPHSQIGTQTRRMEMAASIGFAILILSIVCAYLLGRSLTVPMRQLASAASNVFTLDTDPKAPPPLKHSLFRELDEAAGAVNSLLSGLFWFNTYLPRTIVKRLLRGNFQSVQSEERMVTVMFTDIYGYSKIAERQSPERVMEFLNEHFTMLASSVEDTDGTVDKYIGDSMMAFWGAPDDQPDHAARGCRAILAIAESVRADNIKRIDRGAAPFRVRIGLHTGPAIAGDIGAPGRVNYTVVGDTVNVANRLEQLGKEILPDDDVALLVSEETARLAGEEFGFEEKGTFNLRGREAMLTVLALRRP